MAERPTDLRALYALLGVLTLAGLIYFAVPRGGATSGGNASSASQAPSIPASPTTAVPANTAPTSAPSVGQVASAPSPPGAPPLDYPVASIEPKNEEKLTPEETIKHQKHAIELLEDAISRTQSQLDKSTKSGDDAGVHNATIRLQRLRDVLAKRRAELGDAG